MARIKVINIDGEKLRNEFNVRNITFSSASVKCGYEASYFSKVCNSGKITQPAINLLQANYNIKYDDYKLTDETAQVEKESVKFTITDEVSDRLYKIIYSAVYHAMKQALSE